MWVLFIEPNKWLHEPDWGLCPPASERVAWRNIAAWVWTSDTGCHSYNSRSQHVEPIPFLIQGPRGYMVTFIGQTRQFLNRRRRRSLIYVQISSVPTWATSFGVFKERCDLARLISRLLQKGTFFSLASKDPTVETFKAQPIPSFVVRWILNILLVFVYAHLNGEEDLRIFQ